MIGGTPRCSLADRDPADIAAKLIEAVREPGRTDGRERIDHLRHDRIARRIQTVYEHALSPGDSATRGGWHGRERAADV